MNKVLRFGLMLVLGYMVTAVGSVVIGGLDVNSEQGYMIGLVVGTLFSLFASQLGELFDYIRKTRRAKYVWVFKGKDGKVKMVNMGNTVTRNYSNDVEAEAAIAEWVRKGWRLEHRETYGIAGKQEDNVLCVFTKAEDI